MDDRKRKDPDDKAEKRQPVEERMPPAGPHARPELTNPDATPGTGALPDQNTSGDADGGTG